MSLSLKSVMQEYRTGTNNINILNIFNQLPYQICVAGLFQIDMTVLSNWDYEIAMLNTLKISIHKYLCFRHANYQVYLQKKIYICPIHGTTQTQNDIEPDVAVCSMLFFQVLDETENVRRLFYTKELTLQSELAETIRRLKGLPLRRKYPNWEPNLTKSASPT